VEATVFTRFAVFRSRCVRHGVKRTMTLQRLYRRHIGDVLFQGIGSIEA
jgi:hypothetical protein